MKTLDSILWELRQQGVTLWLEADRLRYRSPEGAISPKTLAELKARKAEILAFLQQVNTEATHRPPLVAIERQGQAALSVAQQRFWLLHQFEPNSSAHNMPVVLRLTGQLNIPALEQSLKELGRRHAILRTTFPVVDGEPRQQIAPELEITLRPVDLRSIPADQREAAALQLATAAAQQPFDLAAGPMLHVSLLQLADQEYLFLWSIHCITGDGSSSDIFYQDLTTLYVAFAAGQPSPLPELPIQYVDFAEWQRNWLQGAVLEQQLDYWKRQLSGNLAAIQLPTDYPRPPRQTFRGDRCPRMFSPALHTALVKLSQQTGTTLFMVLLTAFKALLFRYSDQEDLLISFTNAGRNQVETERLIGFFSGTLLLRTSFAGNPSFRALLHQVRGELLEAYAHQDLPFEKLVEELRPEQNQSRSPLFQIKFALNPPWTNGRGMSSVQLPDLTIESLFGYIYHGETKFDLILVMREQAQGLGAVFDYNADLFDLSTAERMMDHFQTLLEAIVLNPDQSVLDLPLLTPAEQQRLNLPLESASVAEPSYCCVQQAFAAQVDQTPTAIALIAADHSLTYRELDQRANQLAGYLQQQGVKPGAPVGICLHRSPWLMIALLAVLKTGGIYVPLDLADAYACCKSLEAAQVPVILTQQTLAGLVREAAGQVICLDLELIGTSEFGNPEQARPEHTACIRYETSDSGQLSGLEISHRAILHLTKSGSFATLDSTQIVLQHTDLMQPPALFEIWGSLLNGATLVLAPSEPLTPADCAALVQHHAITTLWLSVRLLHRLVDEQFAALQSVRQLLTSGDWLAVPPVKTLLQFLPTCQLSYLYSAPGSAAFTCCHRITELTPLHATIPVGKAMANVQIYLLNSQRQPVPIGVPGELYVGGDSLASGYFNQPALTAEHFVLNPFNPQAAKLYKTGELMRGLPDGKLERIGAVEQLVKLQGWRIELGRVETLLSQHSAVREALVIAHRDLPKDEALVAYVVLQLNQAITAAELRSALRQQLPLLMIPSHFVFLDAIPLSDYGTVDPVKLPFPSFSTRSALPQLSSNSQPDQLEPQMLQIWTELFGIQEISLQDNFFDLGGDSLLAIRLFTRLEQVFAEKLPLSVLLSAPTIEQLAAVLRQEHISDLWSPLVPIQIGDATKTPLFCIHGMGFNVLIYRDLAANLSPRQPVYGLQARGLDGDKDRISDRLETMAADYIKQIQTVQPQGPYLLAGLSNGGNIALEMAQQLLAQGQEVSLVAMFDTFGPNSVKILSSLPRFLSSLKYFIRFKAAPFIAQSIQKPTLLLSELKSIAKLVEDATAQPETQPPEQSPAESLIQTHSPLGAQISLINRWMDQFSQYILDHSSWSFLPKHLLKEVNGSLSETIQVMEAAYRKIQAAYEPSPYPGKIVLFRASETPPGYWVDPQMGWGKIAQAGLDLYQIPGDHTSILASPILAKQLESCLAKIERLNQTTMPQQVLHGQQLSSGRVKS